jgi:hypothetical protein
MASAALYYSYLPNWTPAFAGEGQGGMGKAQGQGTGHS